LEPLDLVPAAKSEPWAVDEKCGWVPRAVLDGTEDQRAEKPPIRPLAHMTVRDQTWATTVMLCLADAVETRQGDCSRKTGDTDFFTHRKNRMYSYGNRLICDWKEGSPGSCGVTPKV